MIKDAAKWFYLPMLAFVSCAAHPQAPDDAAADRVTVFEGARLIIGDESAPIENGTFVVEGARITAVGAAGEVDAPPEADRVDLAGMTVMPAIIDTHTHLGTDRQALLEDLRQRARFGVGAALSLGHDVGDTPVQVRAESESMPGVARYRTAGRGLTAPEPGRSEAPHWVTTESDARAAVRELAEMQVDIVKIWVDDRNGQYDKLAPAVYQAIIDEAHRHDLRVTAHIYALDDAKALLRAGIDAFAHGIRDTDVDDELVTLFKERPHVVLVPNLPERGAEQSFAWLQGRVPESTIERLETPRITPEARAAYELQARNLARLAREGVRIALGTDGNSSWAPHIEMADMVAAGLSEAEVIVAATRNSAEFLRIDAGTLAAGKSADFLVLEANPLDDITNTRRIADIYLKGDRVQR